MRDLYRPPGMVLTDAQQRMYWVWAAMIQRCENPRSLGYPIYGAKGIGVCERWRRSFVCFLVDVGLPPFKGASIDRIDAAKGYAPDNVRWATRQQQNDNRPSWCYDIEVDGVPMNLKQAWSTYSPAGVSYRAAVKRIERGWPVSMAILIPDSVGIGKLAVSQVRP